MFRGAVVSMYVSQQKRSNLNFLGNGDGWVDSFTLASNNHQALGAHGVLQPVPTVDAIEWGRTTIMGQVYSHAKTSMSTVIANLASLLILRVAFFLAFDAFKECSGAT